LANLEAAESRDAVAKVVFTHAHPDHIWGTLDEFDAPNFPTPCVIARTWNFWMGSDVAAKMPVHRQFFIPTSATCPRSRIDLKPSSRHRYVRVRTIDTAGHTPAIAIEVASSGVARLVVGDTIAHPTIAFAHPDWKLDADLMRIAPSPRASRCWIASPRIAAGSSVSLAVSRHWRSRAQGSGLCVREWRVSSMEQVVEFDQRQALHRDRTTTYVYLARALRDFGDGFIAILLPVYLTALGFDAFEIGIVATLALFGSALTTLAIGHYGARVNQRRMLIGASAIMVVTGVVFAVSSAYWLVLLVSFAGTINPSSGSVSIRAPEHAVLSRSVTDAERTRMFARPSLIGAIAAALGSLASGSPDLLVLIFTHMALTSRSCACILVALRTID
jgi:hypothetical protein